MKMSADKFAFIVLLFGTIICLNFAVESVNTFYCVIPSQQQFSLKKNHTCITLAEYAAKKSNYFANYSVIKLKSGNHYLDSDLRISNIQNLTISSVTTLGSQSNENTTIICNENTGLKFEHVQHVQIQGIKFIGCTNNRFVSVDHFKMEDCTLHGNGRNGSALYLKWINTVRISRSIFSTHAQGTEMMGLGYFEVTRGGAAIVILSSENVTVEDTMFINNTITAYIGLGGAVYAKNVSHISFRHTAFNENGLTGVSGKGGAIYVHLFGRIHGALNRKSFSMPVDSFSKARSVLNLENCTFTKNFLTFFPLHNRFRGRIIESVDVKGVGGAVYATDSHSSSYSNINCISSTFNSNKVTAYTRGDGGAIAYESPRGAANIDRCKFTNNTINVTAQAVGGAVYTSSPESFHLVNSTFANNSLFSNKRAGGGAVYTESHSVSLTGVLLLDNTVTAHVAGGAAVYVYCKILHSTVDVSDSVFNRNVLTGNGDAPSGVSGGAMYIFVKITGIRAGDIFVEVVTHLSLGGMYNDLTRERASVVSMDKDKPMSGSFYDGGDDVAVVTVINSLFTNNVVNAKNLGQGGAIAADFSKVIVKGTNFTNNIVDSAVDAVGGALKVLSGTLLLTKTLFTHNIVTGRHHSVCAGVFSFNSHVEVYTSTFLNNVAELGAAVMVNASHLEVVDSTFNNNSVIGHFQASEASGKGGAIYANTSSIVITNSLFSTNNAKADRSAAGGAVYVTYSNITVHSSNFTNNSVTSIGGRGGAMVTHYSTFEIERSTFISNVVKGPSGQGGALVAFLTNLTSYSSLKVTHNSANAGAVFALQSLLTFSGSTTFSNNNGSSLLVFSSNVTFMGDTLIMNNFFIPNDFSLLQNGGAVTTFQSEVVFMGNVQITSNVADRGGAITVTESKLYTYGNLVISHNKASFGGGVYAYHSELNFRGITAITSNTAAKNGGGISAVGSTTKFAKGTLHFVGNQAKYGGGMCLELNSKLYIIKTETECIHSTCTSQKNETWLTMEFSENFAELGGALYVTDDTNSGICAARAHGAGQSTSRECFFQALSLYNGARGDLNLINTQFSNNTATKAGDILYGGLLDRCTLSPFAEIIKTYDPALSSTESLASTINATSYFLDITNLKQSDLHSPKRVSSDAVRVCFCKENRPDCNYFPPPYHVKKGKMLEVSLVVVDQVDNTISNVTVHAFLSLNATLNEKQYSQNTFVNGSCTPFQYNVYSPNAVETLSLYAEGPCSDIGMSTVSLTVYNAPCPIGFKDNGSHCDCDPDLEPKYVTNCFIDTESVLRKDNVWFDFSNNSNHQGYVLHQHCPLDYCRSAKESVHVNLNILNGADEMCAFNRTGKLCGSCAHDLSLPFGSSRCIPCENNRLGLLILFAFAGLALILLLYVLNLTVSVGTINGLIFYSNVIGANKAIFFPFEKPNIATVFIAWLNLDVGFETCFYDGMNAYERVWLQLAFPAYIIFLVTMVIIVSEHSQRFTRILRLLKTNPIAMLATLILLSYTKFIRIIIAALSSATLKHTDGSNNVVWLLDGNVPYLQGKHIPLFVAAIFILIASLIYTLLLLLWQWLMRSPKGWIFKWTRNTKLNSFMEVYHAPYSVEHRYWGGVLLLARIVLYIISTLNFVDDPNFNLTSIICVVGGLQLWSRFAGKIYQNRILEVLESSYMFNVIIFAVLTLYISESNEALAYTSTSIALFMFCASAVFHSYIFLFKDKFDKLKEKRFVLMGQNSSLGHNQALIMETQSFTQVIENSESISVTEINATPPIDITLTGNSIALDERSLHSLASCTNDLNPHVLKSSSSLTSIHSIESANLNVVDDVHIGNEQQDD